ncbi:MAG: hypothetical protein KA257_10775 [Opitutaceae bacterium]|nr:hypothetical protein [Opitutaceae bacterium]MBP9912062.1 hypothetical protein [Opitutaceae bacterium]
MNRPVLKSKAQRWYAALGLLAIAGLLFAYYTGDQANSVGSSVAFNIDTRDADADVLELSLSAAKNSGLFTIDTRDPDAVSQATALASSEASGFFTIDTRDPDAAVYAVSQTASAWSGFFIIDTMADSSTRAVSGYFTIDTMDPDSLTRDLSLSMSAVSAWFTINTLAPPPEDNDADSLHDLWETLHFGSILTYGATDDPDGDGLSNFAEFAFGIDPLKMDSLSYVEFSIEPTQTGNRLVLRHTKNILAEGMVDYAYEISADLVSWTDNTASWVEIAAPQSKGDYAEWFTMAYDVTDLPPVIFVRIKVTPKP